VDGERRSARIAVAVAVALGLVLAWSQGRDGPSRIELAQALSATADRPVRGDDLRAIGCTRTADGQGYACHWRQRMDGDWLARSGLLRADAQGWRLAGNAR
jgi:hypothetical protein